MKQGMSVEDLLTEIKRQRDVKEDFVVNTEDNVSMVQTPEDPSKVALVILREGETELRRVSINDNCHKQIAARLRIPQKHYFRLLEDHQDLVLSEVNALFNREPSNRMIRVLDGVARAFLSDVYKRIDHHEVVGQMLPQLVNGEVETEFLQAHINESNMAIKALFTDPRLTQTITNTRDGREDTVQPGLIIRNSETGHGSWEIRGFFYRAFCWNGCIFGLQEMFNFKRTHRGARLTPDMETLLVSEETVRLENEAFVSQARDCLNAIASPEHSQKMGDALRKAASGETIQHVIPAMAVLAQEVGLTEDERDKALENLIEDQDYSRWGALNAVTKLANKTDSFARVDELEEIGAQILQMNNSHWMKIATAEKEKVAIAA